MSALKSAWFEKWGRKVLSNGASELCERETFVCSAEYIRAAFGEANANECIVVIFEML